MTFHPFRHLSDVFRYLGLGLILITVFPVQAQFRVDVSGVGMNQLPIAVSAFRGEDSSPQKIATIVQADLERSGQFRGVDTAGVALDEASRPDVVVWRQKGAAGGGGRRRLRRFRRCGRGRGGGCAARSARPTK